MRRKTSGWSFVLGLLGSGAMCLSSANAQAPGCHSCAATQSTSLMADGGYFAPQAQTGCGCDSGGCNLRGGCNTGGCGSELGDPKTLFGNCDEPCLNIGGWFSMGYHSESNDLFNSSPDGFNLHQGWLFVEKEAKSENGGIGLGFRFDGMYGIDANDTQAFGNPGATWDLDPRFTRGGGYGWALPQVYGEVAMGDFSVKVGHFYTLVGYEVVTAPDNFFYSHAITMYNSEPFTHTGAIATWALNDNLTVYGGWTAGWDTGFDFTTGSNFLGGFTRQFNEDASLTYITTFGDFGARGSDAYSHSFVLDMTLTENLSSVLQSDLVRVGSTGEDNVGLNHYMFYKLSDRVSIGKRSEWWKGDNITGYAPHGGVLPAGGSHSHYAQTVGLNVRANSNVTFRPEYRYNFSPAVDYEESVLGFDMVVTY